MTAQDRTQERILNGECCDDFCRAGATGHGCLRARHIHNIRQLGGGPQAVKGRVGDRAPSSEERGVGKR